MGSIYNISLVSPKDRAYSAWMASMAQRSREGRYQGARDLGEYIGGLVERCAYHHLGQVIPLQEERILCWRDLADGPRGKVYYQELDGAIKEGNKISLYEIKLTTHAYMNQGRGLKQLEKAKSKLIDGINGVQVLQRLVYVSDEEHDIQHGRIPKIEIDDSTTPVGVIWINSEAINESAKALEIELPDNWIDPLTRWGSMTTDENWQEYAESRLQANENFESPFAVAFRNIKG